MALLTPTMIRELGAGAYGTWTLAYTWIGFLAFVDLGVPTALVRFLDAKDQSPRGTRERWISNFRFLARTLAALGTLGVLGLALFLPTLGATEGLGPDFPWVLFLVGLRSIPVPLLAAPSRGILFAERRVPWVRAAEMAGCLLNLIGSLVLLPLGHGLVSLASWNLLSASFEAGLTVWFARGLFGESSPRFDREKSRRTLAFGLQQVGIQLTHFLNHRADTLILSSFLPLPALGAYGLASRLAEASFGLGKQAIDGLAPDLKGSLEHSPEILPEALRVASVAGALGFFAVFGWGELFLEAWVPALAQEVYLPWLILTAQIALALPVQVLASWQCYSGGASRVARWSRHAATVNFVLSWVLVGPGGMVGVAFATLISQIGCLGLPLLRLWWRTPSTSGETQGASERTLL